MRIRLETDALYLILQNIMNGNYSLIVSPVHLKEIEAIEDIRERIELMILLDKFGVKPSCNLKRVREREETSDVFITCDDKILKKTERHDVKVLTMNPIEFCAMEDLNEDWSIYG